FADAYEAPVYLNSLSRGMHRADHEHFLVHSRSKALEQADVVLDLATPFDFRLNFGEGVNRRAKVVHADTTAAAIGRHPVDVGLVGSLRETLRLLHAALHGRKQPSRSAWLAELRAYAAA